MPIPIDPAITAAALPFISQFVSTPLTACNPPPEGKVKSVNMEIPFNNGLTQQLVWLVDLGAGNPPPLSQISGLYIDATNSPNDITILFADTGYTVRCGGGNTLLVPAFTTPNNYKFYVINENNNGVAFSETVKLFLLNQFLPEFSGDVRGRVLEYGLGISGNTIAGEAIQFARSALLFSGAVDFTVMPYQLVSADALWIEAIDVAIQGYDAAGPSTNVLRIEDNSTGITIFTIPFYMTAAPATVTTRFNLSGLKLVIDGNPAALLRVSVDNPAALTVMNAYINLYGGRFF